MGKAFHNFSKESGRLARLAQKKKKICIPSEAFNHLLAQRMEDVERSFQSYMRRKAELLTYIQATAGRADALKREHVDSKQRAHQPRSLGLG